MPRSVALTLACTLAALAVAACTGAPPTITAPPPAEQADAIGTAAPTLAADAERLAAEVLTTEMAVGLERIRFTLTDAQGGSVPPNSTVDVGIYRVQDIAEGQTFQQRTASGQALFFGSQLPDGGAWVVYHDFDSSGPWSMETTVTFPDKHQGAGTARFEVQGRTQIPRIGDRAPAADTPKAAAGADVTTLTGDPEPNTDLYALSVADAVAAGKPAVVIFAAPATCPVCAETLAEVKAVLSEYGSQASFIHVESSNLADPAQSSAAAAAWGLPANVPWTFVLDPQGYVQARVEGPIDRVELGLLVKRALGQ